MEKVTPSSLATLGGNEILNDVYGGTFKGTFVRRWMSHFAASPTVCTIIWKKLFPDDVNIRDEHMPRGAHPRHLLWALYFLKVYPKESVARSLVSTTNMTVDEKTWRKWTTLFVDAISYLESEVIVWESRHIQAIAGNTALTTFDGTDLKAECSFDKRFYSHKFKGAGLRYELGICIQTGHIVWINGPFRAGFPDISIFRHAAKCALDDGEKVEADGGYRGEGEYIYTPNKFNKKEDEEMRGLARNRHETVNGRNHNFGVLGQTFRHPLDRHSSCFRACCVITQLNMATESPAFQVEYELP